MIIFPCIFVLAFDAIIWEPWQICILALSMWCDFWGKPLGYHYLIFFLIKIGQKGGKRTGLLIKKTLIRLRKNHVLFAGWEVRMVKNCDLGHIFSPYGPTLSRQITFFFNFPKFFPK